MKRQQAEQIAEQALTFLANRPENLQQFLTASGLDASELIARAEDPDIRSAVLGFVAADETLANMRELGVQHRITFCAISTVR